MLYCNIDEIQGVSYGTNQAIVFRIIYYGKKCFKWNVVNVSGIKWF